MSTYSLLKSDYFDNNYILVFSPDVFSINDELQKLVEDQIFPDESFIQMDLVNFVGDRPERYVQFQVYDGKILKNQSVSTDHVFETIQKTMLAYSMMSETRVQEIYPIEYRNKVLKLKKKLKAKMSKNN